MRRTIIASALVASAIPAAPVFADPPEWAPAHGRRAKEYRGHDYARYYDDRGHYDGPRWRGDDGRYRCRRSDGTVGLIVGGAAGALAGRAIDRRGDRALGTILGAAGGALIGREIDSGVRCR